MKVCVSGSRTITDRYLVWDTLDSLPFEVTLVIHGDARGPDTYAKSWARRRGIPYASFPVDTWDNRYDGHTRNGKMALETDYVLAFWDGESAGTKDMIEKAGRLGKTVQVVNVGFGFLSENRSGNSKHTTKQRRTRGRPIHDSTRRRKSTLRKRAV